MKNKTRNILIITLFFIFIIPFNNKCFADFEFTESYLQNVVQISFSYLIDKNVNLSDVANVAIFSSDTSTYLDIYFLKDSSVSNPHFNATGFYNYCFGLKNFALVRYNVLTNNFSNFTVYLSGIKKQGDYINYLNSNTFYCIKNYYGEYLLYNSFDTYLINSSNSVDYPRNCSFSHSNNIVYFNFYSPVVYETSTLYIDDMNFRKRFKFQFNIPMVRLDTKYYVFLENYNRINYDSVSATFRIYTITTPEGYDYTNYENYMYYDNLEKKLYLPAGCEIKEYSCTGTNGDLLGLILENEFVASRDLKNDDFSVGIWQAIKKDDSLSFAQYVNGQYLVPTNVEINGFSPAYFIYNNVFFGTLEAISRFLNISKLSDVFDFSNNFYKICLHTLYYSTDNSFNFNNFCFSNSSIVSYENEKNCKLWNSYFYSLYRKTKIYNLENMINSITYSFQYTDSEDVSSMLPQGTSVEYLTSPFYKDNENSSSGGYITYDIQEVLQGDKVIDYSKEDNSIHNNFNGDYIENFEEGDNIVINNYYTETIEKTSDEHLLHNIYTAILELKIKLSDIGNSISNTTNNFTYNTENTLKYYVVPNSYALDDIKSQISEAADEHLGIIAEPFHRYSIYFHCYFWYCNK